MCGRFAQFSALETLQKSFPIDTITCDAAPSYNVAPTQEILSVIRQRDNRLVKQHWGLVPFWAKDLSGASRLINARSETVTEKPSFRNAFKHRRCLILADGFFEWKRLEDRKQPWFLTLPSKDPFGFAGLWEEWKNRDGSVYNSCTILTIEADESVRDIHHRMPVILLPEAYTDWLNPDNHDSNKLEILIREMRIRKLTAYPVSRYVNAVRNNDPTCIEPIKNSE